MPVAAPVHVVNWSFGWGLILVGFLVGAGIGLFFDREDFGGGYGSFRRRIVRLGHVALAALGMLNVLYALSPWPGAGTVEGKLAVVLLVFGGVVMPGVCFLAGWRKGFRKLFPIPVIALVGAVLVILLGGLR